MGAGVGPRSSNTACPFPRTAVGRAPLGAARSDRGGHADWPTGNAPWTRAAGTRLHGLANRAQLRRPLPGGDRGGRGRARADHGRGAHRAQRLDRHGDRGSRDRAGVAGRGGAVARRDRAGVERGAREPRPGAYGHPRVSRAEARRRRHPRQHRGRAGTQPRRPARPGRQHLGRRPDRRQSATARARAGRPLPSRDSPTPGRCTPRPASWGLPSSPAIPSGWFVPIPNCLPRRSPTS